MKWIIRRIDDADYGCEERLPGEPLMVLVTVEAEDGRTEQFEVADNWLISQNLNEDDEWPLDLDMHLEGHDSEGEKSVRQSDWMENYLDAINEMNDNW